jgi:hypothetical protein
MFEETTKDYHREEGGEQHVRTLGPNCWVSVLHRRTGFGHMEWETAICRTDPETGRHVQGSPFIVVGDWRTELAEMPEGELMAWYESKIEGNRTMFDKLMELLRFAE